MPEPSVWNKLNPYLASIYAEYLHAKERKQRRLNVTLRYTGDLAEIEALGFVAMWRQGGGSAAGPIDLADLERLTSHPGVIKVSIGHEARPFLDKSIPDIKANEIWSVADGVFSGDATGKGVIVGVIDTGIDIHHPFFLKSADPPTSRIVRIWDQGLVPTGAETSPKTSQLADDPAFPPAVSYGVEYTGDQIDEQLRKAPLDPDVVRHRDCAGHGTHVASIAAGNGRAKFKYIGVAPEADLIIVKLLYPQTKPTVAGVEVGFDQRFKDAVNYILNTAREELPGGPPAVINCSFGGSVGPHDGFTGSEIFLTEKFAPAATRRFLVIAAGNEAASGQHVEIDFTEIDGGSVDMKVELFDGRTMKQTSNFCTLRDETEDTFIQLYYPETTATVSVKFLTPDPDEEFFFDAPGLGDTVPPEPFGRGQELVMTHTEDNATSLSGVMLFRRNNVLIRVKPDPMSLAHYTGTYTLRVQSDGPVKVHVWCDQGSYGFLFRESPPLPARRTDKSLIAASGGADNVLTVASYNAESASKAVAGSSSRGPLVRYSELAPARGPKPDLAAPGVEIDAARSNDVRPGSLFSMIAMKKNKPTKPFSGTSMAAPHVAGTVALIMEKEPGLTVAEIIDRLKRNVRAVPDDEHDDLGVGRLDAEKAFSP